METTKTRVMFERIGGLTVVNQLERSAAMKRLEQLQQPSSACCLLRTAWLGYGLNGAKRLNILNDLNAEA